MSGGGDEPEVVIAKALQCFRDKHVRLIGYVTLL